MAALATGAVLSGVALIDRMPFDDAQQAAALLLESPFSFFRRRKNGAERGPMANLVTKRTCTPVPSTPRGSKIPIIRSSKVGLYGGRIDYGESPP
jgi:hypothetical protein